MTRAQARAELRANGRRPGQERHRGATVRLLEPISLRVEGLELRAALVEEGARAMLRGIRP